MQVCDGFSDFFMLSDLAGFDFKSFPPLLSSLFNLDYLDISDNHLRSLPANEKCWRRIKYINLG